MNCPQKLYTSSDCTCDILPKGTYYIGDPCYAIGTTNDNYWSKLCKVMFNEQKQNSAGKWNKDKKGKKKLENYGLMVSNPKKKDNKFYDVAIFDTAYGDGTYEDVESHTGDYMVDAGIIGAIPIEAIPKNKKTRHKGEWKINGGEFVTFEDDIHCYTDGRYLHFGNSNYLHIAIDTNPSLDDEIIEEAIIDNRPWT